MIILSCRLTHSPEDTASSKSTDSSRHRTLSITAILEKSNETETRRNSRFSRSRASLTSFEDAISTSIKGVCNRVFIIVITSVDFNDIKAEIPDASQIEIEINEQDDLRGSYTVVAKVRIIFSAEIAFYNN